MTIKIYPATQWQKRFWLAWEMAPTSTAYNLCSVYDINGLFDINKFKMALSRIINEHDCFRTRFSKEKYELCQHISDQSNVAIEDIELSNLDENYRMRKQEEIIKKFRCSPFNLLGDKLFRVLFIRLSDDKFILAMSLHHIITDGLSLISLYSLLTDYYNDQESHIVKQSMKEYVAQEKNYEFNQALYVKEGLAYWSNQYADKNLHVNLQGKVMEKQSCKGHAYYYFFDEEETRVISKFCTDNKTTLFCLLAAVIGGIIYRYGNQNTFSLLYSVNARPKQFNAILGCFVNNIPLAVEIKNDDSFLDIIERITRQRIDDKKYQYILYSDIIEKIRENKNIITKNIFNISIDQTLFMDIPLNLNKVVAKPRYFDDMEVMDDLNIGYQVMGDKLGIRLHYRADAFERFFIRHLLGCFIKNVRNCVVEPKEKIDAISLLDEEALQKYIIDFNKTEIKYSISQLLHDIFEIQVANNPDSIAISSESAVLTYEGLNARANRLANFLINNGVIPNSLVGICLNPGINWVVAIFAILKAGAGYLPLDPDYPIDRLLFMLQDSGACQLITEEKLVQVFLPFDKPITVIDKQNLELYDAGNPHIIIDKNHIAYVIYTSGTTGKPKAVVITHANIVGRICGLLDIYQVDHNWIHLQYSSYSFDASLEEILLALLLGGQVIVAPQDAGRNPKILIDLIEQYKITAINFVPTVLKMVMDEIKRKNRKEACSSLECVISGGEVLSYDYVQEFYQLFTARLFNTYGPTENTIDSTYFICSSNERYDTVPIGKPLPNSVAYILDDKQRLVPPGIIGELYVGGVGVALAYLGRNDLTQEKFISNFYVNGKQIRLYRTGDLVRAKEDTNLEYVGRLDEQVKIRGLRIELGEIRSVLLQSGKLNDAIVVIKSHKNAEKNIVAYLIVQDLAVDHKVLINSIRKYAQQKLPSYMVPAQYTVLQNFPRTINGKIDYAALPDADVLYSEDVHISQSNAQSNTIKLIINFCNKIFGSEKINSNSDFFELGGHSLMAIQLIARINEHFHIDLPVRTLFDYPVIINLAEFVDGILDHYKNTNTHHINTNNNHNNNSNRIIFEPVAENIDIPVSYQQQAIWLAEQMIPNTAAYNIPAIYEIKGVIDIKILEAAFKFLLDRHKVLTARFENIHNNIYFNNRLHENFKLNIVDFTEETSEHAQAKAREYIQKITQTPYDLGNGPLYRVSLICLAQQHYLLLLNIHHIVFDGISSMLLTKELSIIYADLLTKRNISLQALPVQYSDYAYHYRKWQESSGLEKQLAYWKDVFQELSPLLQLPYDYSRPKRLDLAGSSLIFEFPKILTMKIKQLSKQFNCTLYSVLFSAFLTLLYRYTNQTKLVVGTTVSNRSYAEVENLIGLFINIIPIYVNVDKDKSFSDFSISTHHIILDALSNKDVPFEILLNACNIPRDSSYNPLFQVVFVLENTSEEILKLGKADIAKLSVEYNSAKYDLGLYLDDQGDYVKGRFEFNTVLFKQATIKNMLDHFVILLEEIVLSPSKVIGEYKLLSGTDIEAIKTFNNTRHEFFDKDKLLHQLFERQVIASPRSIAVITPERHIEYGVLDRACNRLAKNLLNQNIHAGELVAVVMEKGWEQVVAVLAILKSGAVYLPINADEPIDRMLRILQKCEVQLLLTQAKFLHFKNSLSMVNILEVQDTLLMVQDDARVSIDVNNQNLAYVIFTSGSTGEPKGVMISHQSVVNTILDINERYKIKSSDRVFGISQLNFDLSVYDIFGTFAAGASLVLPSASDIKEPKAWLELIQLHRVTVWNSVPALMQMLMDYCIATQQVINNYIRLILLSGDWIPLDLPQKIRMACGEKVEVISLGGATEAAIWSILYPITEVDPLWKSIPYGQPMHNQHVYVLDESLTHQPIGIAGELFIGGKGVGQGYFADPGKTHASFIIHPITNEYLYKTGDLGRLCFDNTIEFLGRKDNQVKVNGYRIELGEIQNQLLLHPDITAALVIMDDQASAGSVLLGYVVLKEHKEICERDILHYLQYKLPDYMIPNAIMFLNQLPLTVNGKIDRKALPKLDYETIKDNQQPQTTTELMLAEIWCKLLNVNNIGFEGHFFRLGGNSLLAVKLLAEIRQYFSVNLTIRAIFEYPTLTKLARMIDVLSLTYLSQNNQTDQGGACQQAVSAQELLENGII